MEKLEWTNIDKSGWDRGEWDNEPDKVQWQDETGLPCLAVRHPRSGNWCGYVGVTEDHPAFGRDYYDVDVDVHGGLTFADKCRPGEDDGHGICHTPGPGEPDHVHWLGFDCAHIHDLAPGHIAVMKSLDIKEYATMKKIHGYQEIYRNLEYVQEECKKLAKQLASMKGG
jgi:hypothetical protein